MKALLMMMLMMISTMLYAQNHMPGLHLQIEDIVFDFNRSNVQEAILFPQDPDHSGILIRLSSASTQKLQKILQKTMGQTAFWIWDGKIISSYTVTGLVDDSLTVFNLPQEAAELFVKSVH